MPDDFTPYRPSNGSEGRAFQAQYCDRCRKDAAWQEYMRLEWTNPAMAAFVSASGTVPQGCTILSDVLTYDVQDERYPGATWIYLGGSPTCLAFDDGSGGGRTEPPPDQLDLFGEPTPAIVTTEN